MRTTEDIQKDIDEMRKPVNTGPMSTHWQRLAADACEVPDLRRQVEQLKAKLDLPCGSCHACVNYGGSKERNDSLMAALEHSEAERDALQARLTAVEDETWAAARAVVERQTDLTELVHFERPSDYRKGVLTCLVALDNARADAAASRGEANQ